MNIFNVQQQSFEQDGNIDPILLVSFIESLYIIIYYIYIYVCVHAKTRFRVYLPKIELLHMMHHLCERHQLLQEQPPFLFLLRDIGV